MKKWGSKHTNNNDRTKLLIYMLKHKNRNIYAASLLALATILMIAQAKKDNIEDTDLSDIALEQESTIDMSNEIIEEIDNELQQEITPDDNSVIYYTDWSYFHIKHIGNKKVVESHHYSDYIYNEETGNYEATCLECGHVDTKKHVEEVSIESSVENSKPVSTSNKDNNKVNDSSNTSSTTTTNNSNNNVAEESNTNQETNNGNNNNNNNTEGTKPTPKPVHQHTWSGWSYYNDSQEVSSCSDCNEKKYQSHSYGSYSYNQASGLEEATCSSCGHVITRSHTHQFSGWVADNDSTHSRTCTVNGDNTKETVSHNYSLIGQDGVNDTYRCSDCGHTMALPHSHTFNGTNTRTIGSASECYQTYQVCSGCGNEVVIETKTSHNYGAPTTSESGGMIYEVYTCSDCGYSYQEEHGHTASYVERVEDVGSDDVCYRVYLHCDYPGCSQHEDILQGEYGHNYQHGSETVFDTTIEFDECTRCHKVINEVETINTGAKVNFFNIFDYLYDDKLLAKEDKEKTLSLKI